MANEKKKWMMNAIAGTSITLMLGLLSWGAWANHSSYVHAAQDQTMRKFDIRTMPFAGQTGMPDENDRVRYQVLERIVQKHAREWITAQGSHITVFDIVPEWNIPIQSGPPNTYYYVQFVVTVYYLRKDNEDYAPSSAER